MIKYLLIFILFILFSCDYHIENKIDKAIVQDKFYNQPGFHRSESFVLLIKYNNYCFHRYVSSNLYSKFNIGDTIHIKIQNEYINGKLNDRYYTIYE